MESEDKTMKPGNKVRLRSGGPTMTVAYKDHDNALPHGPKWVCNWFNKKGNLKEATFMEATLTEN